MQRKRDGLVPIGEVFGSLAGPVPVIARSGALRGILEPDTGRCESSSAHVTVMSLRQHLYQLLLCNWRRWKQYQELPIWGHLSKPRTGGIPTRTCFNPPRNLHI